MARRKAEKEKAAAPVPIPRRELNFERTDSNERRGDAAPPRIQLAGGKPSWRDREASKAASGSDAGSTAPPPLRTSTPMERTDSNERPPAAGPPRLNLAGSKPSWRDREAAKAAGGGAGPDRDAPPARSASGRGPPITRTDSGRGPSRWENGGRDESPAPAAAAAATTASGDKLTASGAPGKYVPKFRREAGN